MKQGIIDKNNATIGKFLRDKRADGKKKLNKNPR